jgi:hypothetical protein
MFTGHGRDIYKDKKLKIIKLKRLYRLIANRGLQKDKFCGISPKNHQPASAICATHQEHELGIISKLARGDGQHMVFLHPKHANK